LYEKDLRVLKDVGVKLLPIKLPSKRPVRPMTSALYAEAAAVFDDLTRAARPRLRELLADA
jgi:hypothetical protein